MIPVVLTILTVGLPILAVVLEVAVNTSLSERHHRHHDTYTLSTVFTSVLVIAMLFMGVLGVLLGWLCLVHVFSADYTVMLGFFAAFVLVMFVMWAMMRRYNVSTYDTYLEFRPFIGRTRRISYGDIEHLRWSRVLPISGSRSLSIIVGGKVEAVLVGALDLEQIVMRINREDLLEE